MPKSARPPAYLLHRPTGQARVRINGRDHYLGRHGSPESKAEYGRLIDEWRLQHDVSRSRLTVDELCLRYITHADEYYRRSDGTPTGTAENIRIALRPLVRLFGSTLAADFGPLKLKAVRQSLIDAGNVRTNINRLMHTLRSAFAWGVENELLPAAMLDGLRAVKALHRGRTKAEESTPIAPVDVATVEKTLPYLPQTVQAMVRLQLLTGARPGEVCILRPCDITIGTDGVWMFRPPRHKTEHHGKERRIFIGPLGQDVLRPFLDRDPEQSCFRPAESEAERNESRRLARKSPMTPSQAARKANAKRRRKPGERYTKDSYARAIRRACIGAGVEVWAPNRLRHTRATELRARYGIEASRVVLGHGDIKVSEVYAERDFKAAANIMRDIG